MHLIQMYQMDLESVGLFEFFHFVLGSGCGCGDGGSDGFGDEECDSCVGIWKLDCLPTS